MKKMLLIAISFLMAGVVNAGIPQLNVKCGDGIQVHADEGGYVYVNGQEASVKKINENYFEASQGGKIISIAINPDGSAGVSYTGKHGANGVCMPENFSAAGSNGTSGEKHHAGSGTMPPDQMPKYCQGAAAGEFNTKPMYVKVDGPATMTPDAGFVVTGKVDLGDEGKRHFRCKFDNFGKFLHVKIQ